MSGSMTVAAVIVASRGGARLAQALASVEWAAERIVLDPAGRLGDEPLPPGVRRARQASEAAAPWVLLLEEHEVVPAPLATTVRGVAEASEPPVAYRIPRDIDLFGTRFALRGAPVRLAPRAGARVRVGRGVAAELHVDGRANRLREPLLGRTPGSLAQAVDDLDADAAALAALLHADGGPPTLRRLAAAPALAGVRALFARGPARGVWVRWTLAVFAGYRAMVAYAKLWEMRRAEGSRRR